MRISLRQSRLTTDRDPRGLQVDIAEVASPDEPLSISEVESYVQVSGDDPTLISLISAVRSQVERRTGRLLVRREVVAQWEAVFGEAPLPYPPHHEVTQVERALSQGEWETLDVTDWHTTGLARYTVHVGRAYSTRGAKQQGLRVTYEAGHESLPDAMRAQMLRDIATLYDYRHDLSAEAVAELPQPSAYDAWRVIL